MPPERVSITPPSTTALLPLSSVQTRIWAAQMLHPDSAIYNIGEYLEIFGSIDAAVFERALRRVIGISDSLHLRIVATSDGPRQFIDRDSEWRLPFIDVSGEPDPREAAERWMRDDMASVADLARGPLFGFALFRAAADRYYWYARYHHLCNDGTGMTIVAHRLAACYSAMVEGGEPDLGDPGSWTEVLEAEDAYRNSPQHALDADFWRTRLSNQGPPATLSGRPPAQPGGYTQRTRWMTHDAAETVRALAARHGAKLHHAITAVAALYLHRITGERDITLGLATAGRATPRVRGIAGMCSKAMPLRLSLSQSDTFGSLLEQVRAAVRDVVTHQQFGEEELRRLCGLRPDEHLFGAVINIMPFDYDLRFAGAPARGHNVGNWLVEDLQLAVYDRGEGGDLRVDLIANPEHYTAAALDEHHERLLDLLARLDDERPLGSVPIVTAAERHRLLETFNETERDVPAATLATLFEEQVAREPDAPALAFAGATLTYAEVNAHANRIAHALIARGIGAESLVGIALHRSFDLWTAVLGVLKAGAAYLPLDPAYPEARRAQMIADARPALVLDAQTLVDLAAEQFPDRNPNVARSVSNPAYVIYTSGSSGVPKGVIVTHAGIASLRANQLEAMAIGRGSRLLQFASLNFDAASWELIVSLTTGATLVLLNEDERYGRALQDVLIHERITHALLPPAVLPTLDENDPQLALQCLIVGGEACSAELAERWSRRRTLLNAYGPTESTVIATMSATLSGALSDAKTPPIGAPITGTRVYVLDAALEPLPVGAAGELYIAGAGLARGYLRRAGLTAERFVADPHVAESGARMYRTGDLARWRADGTLEYAGRSDTQVKLRGHRIELGEIEALLRKHERVQDALVVLHDEQLLGYVVAGDESRQSQVRQWQELYDANYAQESETSDFNLTGWNSSYTGQPLPAGEMRVWVEETVARVRAMQPRRVLEIGCGTGLLLTRLAPECERYIGADFSDIVVAQLQRYCASREDLRHVELRQSAADDLSFVEDGSVDLVILNSVVQYFPSAEYLIDVLAEAARVTRRGGKIFVGDVRSLPLLRAFHTSVQSFRAPEPTESLPQRIDQAIANDEELVVDPALFEELQRGRVEVSPKGGSYDNELSRFRYDVTLTLGEPETLAAPERWLDWDEHDAWRTALETELAAHPGDAIGIRGIRDARLAGTGEDPDAVMRLAQRLGTGLAWQRFGGDAIRDAIFNPRWTAATQEPHRDFRQFTNVPRQGRETTELGLALKAYLQQSLPEAMVPAAVVVLAAWPMTPNGKVDRAALPVPGRNERAATAYRAPRNETETILCELVAGILRLDRVSIDDPFFALGGDSIQSILLVTAARRAGVELTAQNVFQLQTVEALAHEAAKHEPHRAGPEPDGIGDIAPTPIMRWFRERGGPIETFSQSVMLRVPDGAEIDAAMQSLIDTHDMLRLRLAADGTMSVAPRGSVQVRVMREPLDCIEKARREAVARLDPFAGRIVEAVQFAGSGECKLLLVIHHFAVDGVSWRILIDDLQAVWSGRAVDSVRTPFRSWARMLAGAAESPAITSEIPHWQATLERDRPLLRGAALDPALDTEGTARQIVIEVPADAILSAIPAAFRTHINDVLLAALAMAVESWRPGGIVIDLEGHGREPLPDSDIDLSRTVGWFTTLHPVYLEAARDAAETIERVKEQLRAVSRRGLGYGLLRPQLAAFPQPQLSFNYLGRFAPDVVLRGHLDPATPLAHLLEINACVVDGPDRPSLSATWKFASRHLREDDVQQLADAWQRALEALARAAEEPGRGDMLPLSPLQEGLLFHSLYDQSAPDLYTSQIGIELEGPLDAARMRRAAEALLRRHANLTVSVRHERRDRPVQVLDRNAVLPWREISVAELDAEREQRFDFTRGPLLRFALVRLGSERHQLVLTHHHFLLDGWSIPIVLRELLVLYHGGTLPPARPYADFLAWLEQQDKAAALVAWREYLRGFEGPTRVAAGEPSHAQREMLQRTVTSDVQSFARGHGLTLNTVVQGLWALLLAHLTGSDDVVFGVATAGRPAELNGVEEMVGLFINTVPLRVQLRPDEPLSRLLQRIQESQSRMLPWQHTSLAELAKTELFDTLIAFENYPMDLGVVSAAGELRITGVGYRGATHYPLTLAIEAWSGLRLRLDYDPERFTPAAAESMIDRFLRLLDALLAHPDGLLHQLPHLSGEERQFLLHDLNDTSSPLPSEGLAEIFEEQVRLNPSAVAVISETESLTYAELDSRAEDLAMRLRGAGVRTGALIAVRLDRGIEFTVAVLAILKAGAAYLPLDAASPAERERFLLSDSGASFLLTAGEELHELPGGRLAGAGLAYVMYTSGSTGTPKGIAVGHSAVTRLVRNTDYVTLAPGDRIAHAATTSFDAATFEIWGALLNGGTIVVLPRETTLSPSAFAGALLRHRVDTLFITTALFNQIAADVPHAFATLRDVLFGGEAVDPHFVREILRHGPPRRLLHVYGPTENTTFSTWQSVDAVRVDARTVPIGLPIANSTAYVLDSRLEPAAAGVTGELYVGGAGLAWGYLHRAAFTAERFVANPFATNAGARMYRTGDLVRRRDDGAIEFVGRVDAQVKLRGFRIEPSEIETALSAHAAVSQAAVIAREDGARGKQLVAYVVRSNGIDPDEAELREMLGRRLPEYMIPSAFVVIDALPLTANGKLDWRALPAPQRKNGTFRAPRTGDEQLMAAIFGEVLGLERVGLDDDFFELGGHSLLATRLVNRIRNTFRVELPLRDVFRNRTVESLGTLVCEDAREEQVL
jgi:amino acid adenylation domain-containing protein/non-ribosomal peptide synthase protein (TIGR01720 family)